MDLAIIRLKSQQLAGSNQQHLLQMMLILMYFIIPSISMNICYSLTDIMNQTILSTVNINIGLGRDNPSLIIR
jgi:hypothetical protein